VNFLPRALSLDLDDTLWPIWPAIERAEQALDDFLRRHCPMTAARFPIRKMRELRARVASEHPHLAHDFTRQRLLSLEIALGEAGDDVGMAEAALEAFYEVRNRVDFYPDALEALQRLSARAPLVALTNGNADLGRIGIHEHFRGYVSARETGVAKPEPRIFLTACEHLGLAPQEVLHAGDDPHLDVAGAQRAGMRTCWINRRNLPWPRELPRPDLEFATLAGLADWLERHPLSLDPPLSLEIR